MRIVPERILHVMEGEADGRLEIFRRRPELIHRALENPTIVEAVPRYWDKINHFSQTFLIEFDEERDSSL